MSTKYKAKVPDKAYFITITAVNWIDIFTRKEQKFMLINSLDYCIKNKGLEVYAYCVMPSHVHLICRADDGLLLSDLIRDFKKFTSKKVIEIIQTKPESRREWLLEMFAKACEHLSRDQKFKVWQDGYHAEILESEKFTYQKLNYIHNNPVVDRIVEYPEDYLFSSARNYADKESFLEVVVLPPQLKTIS
jgi:REP element-mobilizing transposase RayT